VVSAVAAWFKVFVKVLWEQCCGGVIGIIGVIGIVEVRVEVIEVRVRFEHGL